MKSGKLALFYGFLIWLIVFAVAMAAFPLREPNRPLFESIMPVALTACVTLFAVLYFRSVAEKPMREGVWLGLIWFILNFGLDQLLFSAGPMAMSFVDYISDIGITYLIIPIVPFGMGVALSWHEYKTLS